MKNPSTFTSSHEVFKDYKTSKAREAFPTQSWKDTWQQVCSHIYNHLCLQKEAFLWAYVSKELQTIILAHKNVDMVGQLRKQLIKIFYKVYNFLVESKIDENDPLLSFIEQYKRIMPRINIVVNCLYLQMSRYTTKAFMQNELAEILIKQLMKCSYYETFTHELMGLVEKYRDICLHPEPMNFSVMEALESQLQLMVKVGVFGRMRGEYVEKSKKYYCELLPKIPKNISVFTIVNNYILLEERLKTLLPCRGRDQQSMIQVLSKEIIEELYVDMIQYMDLMFLQPGQHGRYLQEFWNITKLLNTTIHKPNYYKIFVSRLTEIVSDLRKHIKEPATLTNILTDKQNIYRIIMDYFDEDGKLINLLNNTVEGVLMEEEEKYNMLLCQLVLREESMLDQQAELGQFALFKLTPSKEQFMRVFQQEFSRYVLVDQALDLSQQELFIRAMHKECGNALCKNIDKMINDVWRDGRFLRYSSVDSIMNIRILCKDWPQFTHRAFNLPDVFLEIRERFEENFLAQEENDKKKLQWVSQCGSITLVVCGVQSVFSELQASIIVQLSRSFRPMRLTQLSEVLNYDEKQLHKVTRQLVNHGLINFEDNVYELNTENKIGYKYKLSQKSIENKQKQSLQRDFTILIQAHITRLLKRKKLVQKTDLLKLVSIQLKNTCRVSIDEINRAIEKLKVRDIVQVQKVRGMIKYVE